MNEQFDKLLSSFAFDFIWRPYTVVGTKNSPALCAADPEMAGALLTVGEVHAATRVGSKPLE